MYKSERLKASALLVDGSQLGSAGLLQKATLPRMLPLVPPVPSTTEPGNRPLIKYGTGTLTIAEDATYTGGTTINGVIT
jgi:autotransporter-associated beta strand protein